MPGLLMNTPGLGDLFGEGANAALHQRIDDLRLGSCSRKIAWSKLGCIAYITPDGKGVEIRNLMSKFSDGSWTLSEPSAVANVEQAHQGQMIVHLSWSHVGSDLAVVDILGRVSIFTVYISVDRLNCSRPGALEQEDDLGMLVSFWWLNLEQSYFVCKPAVFDKDLEMYRYPAQQFKPFGPYNPIAAKSASIGVTRGGVIKLWYAQDQSRYHEVSTELEPSSSRNDLFTHASFTSDKDGTIILSAFTHARQLRLYRISINWNLPPQQPGKPIIQIPNPATISTQKIKIEDMAIPSSIGLQSPTQSQLAIVELLPPLPPATPRSPPTPPVILAFYTSSGPQPYSIVCRWELVSAPHSMHPVFNELASRRNSVTNDKEVFELKRLEDVRLNGCILSITQQFAQPFLSISYSDGSSELRDRLSFNIAPVQEDYGVVINMTHAGFSFPNLDTYLDLALSPNNAAMAVLTHAGDVKVVLLKFNREIPEEAEPNNPILLTACSALAQQHCCSCNNRNNNDDLLMVAQQFKIPIFNEIFLTEAHRSLNLNMDFLNEGNNEKLLRNSSIQRCSSLQNALDFKGRFNPKPLSAKIAWTTLHLKMSSIGFAYFMNNVARNVTTNPRTGEGENRAVALQTLLGVVKWEIDLHAYLTDELLDLARKTRGHFSDMAFIRKKVKESNSCALPLVLSSAPRWLLRYNSRALRGFDQTARDSLSTPTIDDEHRQTLQSLRAILDASPIKLSVFERILSDIDATIRNTQRENDDLSRTATERSIFLTGEIPAAFEPVINRLFTHSLPALWNDIEPSAIFFYDTTWLGYHDDKKTLQYKKTHVIDAIRKIPLKEGTKLRRCIRCCEIVEDLVPTRNMGMWLQNVNRTCLCGSLWMHD